MRGGEQDYVLVRKTEPKPLRIFMQDGVHDEWAGAEMGDWWMSNQTMERALSFAGYDVRHTWGTGSHNGAHANAIFPDAMRWLWKDWPEPVPSQPSANRVLKEILQPGQTWETALQGCSPGLKIAADPAGRVFYSSGVAPEIREVAPAGSETLSAAASSCVAAQPLESFAIGPDGLRYVALASGGIAVSTSVGGSMQRSTFATSLHIRDFTIRHNSQIYATVKGSGSFDELWRIDTNGATTRCEVEIRGGTGLAFSPDGLWLFVAQAASHLGLSFRVYPDGQLDAGEPFYDFAVPASMEGSGAGSMAMDDSGRAYVATPMGVQVFDRNGRVAAILPLPGGEAATAVCFGGENFDTLYVSAGGKVYRRLMHNRGASPWAAPHKLPPWGAG
jgi:gluconolactonase